MSKPSNPFLNLATLFTLAVILCLSKSAITTSPPPNFDLSSIQLDPMTTGFTLKGDGSSRGIGKLVGAAGDVDGDGFDDIILSFNERTFVVYGRPTPSFSDMKISPNTLDPATTGFPVEGNFEGIFGEKEKLIGIAKKAGDVNGDGYDDIIFGTNLIFSNYHNEIQDEEGRVYVIFGREKFSEDPSKGRAIPGFVITGIPRRTDSDFSVDIAGDVNGDGYDDIIIGTPSYNDHQGIVYVIYGGPISLQETFLVYRGDQYTDMYERDTISIDVSRTTTSLDPATNGFTIIGDSKFHHFGTSVSAAGDINGDGYDDIIVGANRRNRDQEVAYVIYGGPKSALQHIDLGSAPLDPFTTGFIIKANYTTEQLKIVVSTAGDVDGDGYDDILIGNPYLHRYRGITYVVYGKPNFFLQNIDLNSATLDPSSTGFMIAGANVDDQVGFSVSTAGDVNRDGFDDIIIGAPFTNKSQGAAYVIYGGPRAYSQNIDLNSTTLDPTRTGFMIKGNANFDDLGWAVSTAGDMNGDGFDDIIIGAPLKNRRQGEAYLIHAGKLHVDCIPSENNPCTQHEESYQSKANCKRCLRRCPERIGLKSYEYSISYSDLDLLNIEQEPVAFDIGQEVMAFEVDSDFGLDVDLWTN